MSKKKRSKIKPVRKVGGNNPTENQWALIDKMEKRLKIKFEGKSKFDASRYIREYKREYDLYLQEGYVFGRRGKR